MAGGGGPYIIDEKDMAKDLPKRIHVSKSTFSTSIKTGKYSSLKGFLILRSTYITRKKLNCPSVNSNIGDSPLVASFFLLLFFFFGRLSTHVCPFLTQRATKPVGFFFFLTRTTTKKMPEAMRKRRRRRRKMTRSLFGSHFFPASLLRHIMRATLPPTLSANRIADLSVHIATTRCCCCVIL